MDLTDSDFEIKAITAYVELIDVDASPSTLTVHDLTHPADYWFVIEGADGVSNGQFDIKIHCSSDAPTRSPSLDPSVSPSHEPSDYPSRSPTAEPTPVPSSGPTASPSSTASPTPLPSAVPSTSPSREPSNFPSISPSAAPTSAPSSGTNPAPTSPTPSPTGTEEWTDTTWSDYPFNARVLTEKGSSSYICGGSIIATNECNGKGAILTAAHCAYSADTILVGIGCNDFYCNDPIPGYE